jgi:hypothetical protein
MCHIGLNTTAHFSYFAASLLALYAANFGYPSILANHAVTSGGYDRQCPCKSKIPVDTLICISGQVHAATPTNCVCEVSHVMGQVLGKNWGTHNVHHT